MLDCFNRIDCSGKTKPSSAYLFPESLVCFSLYLQFSFSITKSSFLLLKPLHFALKINHVFAARNTEVRLFLSSLSRLWTTQLAQHPQLSPSPEPAQFHFLGTKVIFEQEELNPPAFQFVSVFIHVYWHLPATATTEDRMCARGYHGKTHRCFPEKIIELMNV